VAFLNLSFGRSKARKRVRAQERSGTEAVLDTMLEGFNAPRLAVGLPPLDMLGVLGELGRPVGWVVETVNEGMGHLARIGAGLDAMRVGHLAGIADAVNAVSVRLREVNGGMHAMADKAGKLVSAASVLAAQATRIADAEERVLCHVLKRDADHAVTAERRHQEVLSIMGATGPAKADAS